MENVDSGTEVRKAQENADGGPLSWEGAFGRLQVRAEQCEPTKRVIAERGVNITLTPGYHACCSLAQSLSLVLICMFLSVNKPTFHNKMVTR